MKRYSALRFYLRLPGLGPLMVSLRSLATTLLAVTRSYGLAVAMLSTCILGAGLPAFSQSHAITIPRNLGQLVDESDSVMQGWVTGVTLERHAQLKNLMTVVVTVQVEESLKGDAVKAYTFSQAVIDKRDQEEKMGYRVGQHVLLILIKPSVYGLSSPAGMEQGWFHIKPGDEGKLLATNGFGNVGLFHALDSHLQAKGARVTPEVQAMIAKPKAGPVSLELLKSLIRTMTAAKASR
jgi:hypothetical protein